MLGELVLLAFAVLAVFIGYNSVKFVPQGSAWTVERFGRYTRTLKPGLAVLVPVVDGVGKRISMMETVVDVPQQEVITRDNAIVRCDAVVFIQVMEAAQAAYAVENLRLAIINLAMTNLRTVVGSLDLDDVLSQRDQINARLLSVIDSATHPWGVKVTRIEIKDLIPPADITQAMARQMKAERERRAQILEAEGDKQAAILRAEGAKQSAVLEAEGRRDAALRDAEARERMAEAEAKATAMVSEAIARGDVNAIRYFLGQKYVEAFAELASSPQQRTVIVPADFAGIAGLVDSLKALSQAADDRPVGDKAAPGTRPNR